MTSDHNSAVLPPPATEEFGSAAWAGLAALGAAGWLACAAFQDPGPVWRALLVNFIFFTPLAAALVVWPAAVMLSRGTWMGPLRQDALAGASFAPLSLLAFAALWLGRSHWAGWLHEANLPNRAWLRDGFLFVRDGAALAVWWTVATVFARGASDRRPAVRTEDEIAGVKPALRTVSHPVEPGLFRLRHGIAAKMQTAEVEPKALAGGVALAYALAFTLLAYDVVMALDPLWTSALFGGYFFISGMYAAVAALALIEARQPAPAPDRLHDLGKLVVTFSIMTTYLMFSQLLPIWYANLPHEIRFAVPRMKYLPWAGVSAALLAVVYLGPLILLLPARAKRSPRYLGAVCLLVLAGLWVERWWLVAPTLGQGFHVSAADVSLGAAFAGALGWGVRRFGRAHAAEPGKAGDRE